MDDEELRDVEEQLRTLLVDLGLTWALVAVDASIADGALQEPSPSRNPNFAHLSWEPDTRAAAKGNPPMTTRPLVAAERVEYLMEALRRITVEVPAIHRESWQLLNQGLQGLLPMIDSMEFRGEDDSLAEGAGAFTADLVETYPTPEAVPNLLGQLRDRIRR